ncbi:hypothetical protein C0Q70_05148 [Pomacea canaliculata]|uniref:Uncharacterized protein n=1 Tax=Pomacea canaliculata TaxID=400727 RepID=A0A2T7PKC5_POMCA|nr:hypothetical protein C0Q70_05148 [Pomacea canaliculata]
MKKEGIESVSHLPLLLHLECVWGQLQSTEAPNQLVVHQRPAANCDGWVVTDSSQPEGSEEGGRTQAGQSSKQRGRQQQKEGVEAMVVTLLLRMIAHTLLSLLFRRRLFIDLPRVHVDQLHLPLLTLQAETWRRGNGYPVSSGLCKIRYTTKHSSGRKMSGQQMLLVQFSTSSLRSLKREDHEAHGAHGRSADYIFSTRGKIYVVRPPAGTFFEVLQVDITRRSPGTSLMETNWRHAGDTLPVAKECKQVTNSSHPTGLLRFSAASNCGNKAAVKREAEKSNSHSQ